MNRRGFLGAVLGALAAPFTPTSEVLGRRGWVEWTMLNRAVVLNDQWVGFVHTDTYRELVDGAPHEFGRSENSVLY